MTKRNKKKTDYIVKDSGDKTKFETGAVRDLRGGKGRFDLLPPKAIRALAIHFEKGVEKYGERNWEKGIPISKYLDSGIRHSFQVLDGMEDENHLIAAIWNLLCAYETLLRVQDGKLPSELNDLPRKIKLPAVYRERMLQCLPQEKEWVVVFRLKAFRMRKHKHRKRRQPFVQTHHISYEPEVTVRLWVGEHWIATQLQRRKRVSKGFITALKEWLRQNESKAVEV